MIDLNTLIPSGSEPTLIDVYFINDRGEIVANGALPNGDQHAVLLVPDGDNEAADSTEMMQGSPDRESTLSSPTDHRIIE
jgi:hypothetical protein